MFRSRAARRATTALLASRAHAAGQGPRPDAPRAGDAPHASETPRAGDAPRASETPRAGDAPRASETPRAGDAPRASEAPDDTIRIDPEPQAPATTAQPSTPSARAVIETLSMIVAPATLITGLLFYFGWMRARTLTLGIGIHPDVLAYATNDYLIGSVDALFWPLATVAALVLVFLWVHVQVTTHVVAAGRTALLGRLVVGVGVGGAVLLLVSVLTAFRPGGFEVAGYVIGYERWLPPLGIVLGILGIDYAVQLRRRLRALRGEEPPAPQTAWALAAQRVALGGLVLLALFWAVTEYALAVGEVALDNLQRDTAWQTLPTVALYSPDDLQLDTPGVVAGRCPPGDSAYRYRYTGLRLFAFSNDKYFLLPVDWPETGGPAIVLPDDPGLRVELLPGRTAPDPEAACPAQP